MTGVAMLTMILTLNGWAEGWLRVMGAVLWQSAVLVALAILVACWLRRSSPAARYWLWQIVAIKLLLMPFWTSAVPFPSWAQSRPPRQSAVPKPAEGLGGDTGRLAVRNSLPLMDRPDPGPGRQAASFWETFTAITWQAWVLLAWFAVVLLQFVRLLTQRLRLAGVLKQGVPADGELARLVAELAGQVGLRRVPAVVSVAGDCPPFVCGLWRPRLVLSGRLLASLNPAERRHVILHELGHVKRRDLIWGWPIQIARMVYFFHPLVYWVAYQLHLERELVCDQLAMAHSGHPPADYAQTLVQVISHASEPAAVQAAAISAGLTGNQPPRKRESQHNGS